MTVEDASHIESEEAHAHQHDEDAAHGAHGHDPNEGVVVGEPPTPAWVWTAALIGLLTAAACVWLGFAIG